MNRGTWITLTLLLTSHASAQWAGFVDRSGALETDRFPFTGFHPEAGGNENYYDGDLGDFDGDGHPDRLLGARYGLLFNTGGGYMEPIRRNVGLLLRGDPGAGGWGEDAMALVDVDGDGDLDAISGGNGEPLVMQVNEKWRFRLGWSQGISALNISPTDVENDGDVDLVIAHSFGVVGAFGGPLEFAVLVNDGSGNFAREELARGLDFRGDSVVGVVSGDLDGDGDYDLVIQRGVAGVPGLTVALNDGDGNYTRTEYDSWPTSPSGFAQSGALGDVDRDGDLDLMIGRSAADPGVPGSDEAGPYPGGHPTILHLLALNDGSGRFTDVSASNFHTGGYTDELNGDNAAILDVDHDGDLDFVAVRPRSDFFGWTQSHFSVFLNDGTGNFTYSDERSLRLDADRDALGADVDIGDIDGDGDYDAWLGFGGDVVRILMNTAGDATGDADVPRSLRVRGERPRGVEIGWRHPIFAANVRRYEVYRSLAPNVEDRDRELLHHVGHPHADQDFFVAIDEHTTTASLGDPQVTIAGDGEVRFEDPTAAPGVPYWYTVQHVGVEHEHSAHAPQVRAMVPAEGGADTRAPELSIVSPEASDWMRYPRIVITYGDASGVDPDSLSVTLDAPLGPLAAGTDLTSMAYRHDEHAFVAYFAPPHELPDDTVVTLTARVSDTEGNEATETVRFFVDVLPAILPSPELPTAAFSRNPGSGDAPAAIDFDASGSSDPDGHILRYEWYFGDGETALGRQVTHTYRAPGEYRPTLLVRDNEGGVAVRSRNVTIGGTAMPDAGPGDADAGVPEEDAGVLGEDAGTCTPTCDGRSCGDDGCGGTCGSCAAGRICGGGECLCEGAAVTCDEECVDLRVDEAHCGACGNECAAGEACSAGECRDDGVCVPDCDGRSCGDDGCGGTCGSCSSGELCAMGGVCVCGDAATTCGGECVDVRSDAAHCGACGVACGEGESCAAGRCVEAPVPSSGGCGCTVPGGDSPLAPFALALLGLIVWRRRRAEEQS